MSDSMRKVSRRGLLKTVAGAGAALMLPKFVPAAALGRDGAVAPSERIVMGAIGIGSRGSHDLGVLLNSADVQFVAICDIRRERRDAVKQLARLSSTYSTLGQWKERAGKIREQILVGAGLYPLPQRRPLNSIVRNKRQYDGYTVESAAFEARPGFLVYGNLYRPDRRCLSQTNRRPPHRPAPG